MFVEAEQLVKFWLSKAGGPRRIGAAVHWNFMVEGDDLIAAALNATEGFTIVLADLTTLPESGTSARISKAESKLITLRG